jgi:hypothetical protein
MSILSVKECKCCHWYEIVDGCGTIKNGSTIQYMCINENKHHQLIGESKYDETGYFLNDEEASKILVSEIFF